MHSITRKSYILFDFDGTLIDSLPIHKALWAKLLSDHNLAIPPKTIEELFSSTAIEIAAALFPKELASKAVKDFEKMEIETDYRWASGAEELVKKLFSREKTLAIVTSSSRAKVTHFLETHNAAQYFKVLVCSDDVTQRKPNPAPYRLALKRLGCAPGEALAVEDSETGKTSAEGAGLECLHVSAEEETLRNVLAQL